VGGGRPSDGSQLHNNGLYCIAQAQLYCIEVMATVTTVERMSDIIVSSRCERKYGSPTPNRSEILQSSD